jgi:hypothetical protein
MIILWLIKKVYALKIALIDSIFKLVINFVWILIFLNETFQKQIFIYASYQTLDLFATLSVNDTEHNDTQLNNIECF